MTHQEMVLRIAIGAALGAVVGYERERHDHPAGLRTHTLVGLAAATFMVVSTRFAFYQGYGPDDPVDVDPSRIASTVVSAIGFIAGGAILRNGFDVRGLTTAAGLWLVTAIGMAAGGGMFVEAVAVTILGLVTLSFFRVFRSDDASRTKRTIEVETRDADDRGRSIDEVLARFGAVVVDVGYERRGDAPRGASWSFEVTLPASVGSVALGDALAALPEVERVRLVSRGSEGPS